MRFRAFVFPLEPSLSHISADATGAGRVFCFPGLMSEGPWKRNGTGRVGKELLSKLNVQVTRHLNSEIFEMVPGLKRKSSGGGHCAHLSIEGEGWFLIISQVHFFPDTCFPSLSHTYTYKIDKDKFFSRGECKLTS
jgi:hypothetical protein